MPARERGLALREPEPRRIVVTQDMITAVRPSRDDTMTEIWVEQAFREGLISRAEFLESFLDG
jgi:hypothetical protein